MTSVIVERLRVAEPMVQNAFAAVGWYGGKVTLLADAAAEIERLRALIVEYGGAWEEETLIDVEGGEEAWMATFDRMNAASSALIEEANREA